jgi:hypothetical protein
MLANILMIFFWVLNTFRCLFYFLFIYGLFNDAVSSSDYIG